MELSQMRYFCALAKIQHFTHTAEELHITQPALSKAISTLETELGITLFDRVGKQVSLNAAGTAFFKLVDPILADFDDVQKQMVEIRFGIQGNLRIGTTFPIGTSTVLQHYLRSFLHQYPAVYLQISTYQQREIERLLLERKLDFGLVLTMPNLSGVDWTRLYTEHLGIVVAKNHPLASRTQIQLKDVAQEKFICHSTVSDSHDATKFICKLAGFDIDIIYSGDDIHLIGQMAAEGRGVTMMSETAFLEQCMDPVWKKELCFLQVADDCSQRPIYILYRSSRYQSALSHEFMNGLVTQTEGDT